MPPTIAEIVEIYFGHGPLKLFGHTIINEQDDLLILNVKEYWKTSKSMLGWLRYIDTKLHDARGAALVNVPRKTYRNERFVDVEIDQNGKVTSIQPAPRCSRCNQVLSMDAFINHVEH